MAALRESGRGSLVDSVSLGVRPLHPPPTPAAIAMVLGVAFMMHIEWAVDPELFAGVFSNPPP
jgi:hypothetical protein